MASSQSAQRLMAFGVMRHPMCNATRASIKNAAHTAAVTTHPATNDTSNRPPWAPT